MANFKIKVLQAAYAAAGRHFSTFDLGQSFGIIGIKDPAFAGRRTGQFGEYLQLRTPDGKTMNITLASGTAKGANKFEIFEMIANETVTIGTNTIHEGDKTFRAMEVVEEEED
jgi:hypothetical protein